MTLQPAVQSGEPHITDPDGQEVDFVLSAGGTRLGERKLPIPEHRDAPGLRRAIEIAKLYNWQSINQRADHVVRELTEQLQAALDAAEFAAGQVNQNEQLAGAGDDSQTATVARTLGERSTSSEPAPAASSTSGKLVYQESGEVAYVPSTAAQVAPNESVNSLGIGHAGNTAEPALPVDSNATTQEFDAEGRIRRSMAAGIPVASETPETDECQDVNAHRKGSPAERKSIYTLAASLERRLRAAERETKAFCRIAEGRKVRMEAVIRRYERHQKLLDEAILQNVKHVAALGELNTRLRAAEQRAEDAEIENRELRRLIDKGRSSTATELSLSAQLEDQRAANMKLLERADEVTRIGKQFEGEARKFFDQSCRNMQRARIAEIEREAALNALSDKAKDFLFVVAERNAALARLNPDALRAVLTPIAEKWTEYEDNDDMIGAIIHAITGGDHA